MRQRKDARGVVVDLLFASSGIEPEIAAAAEVLAITDELALPVARTGHLLALEVLARDDRRRPQDADDLRSLLAVSGAADLELARESVALITARGFHRDRALTDTLEALIRDAARG